RSSVQNVNLFASGGQRLSDLEFDLSGPSPSKLEGYSPRLMDEMRAAGGVVGGHTTLSVRQPELRGESSRDKAAIFGIQVRDIAGALRTLIGGEPISTFREEQDQIDVWLRAQHSNRSDPRAIGDVAIATPRGELVRLSNLASLSEERGPAQIDHYNRQRKVTLLATPHPLPPPPALPPL